jgi:hypothetical protein
VCIARRKRVVVGAEAKMTSRRLVQRKIEKDLSNLFTFVPSSSSSPLPPCL